MTELEYRRTIQLPYGGALRTSQPDRAAKELIDKSIHYQVYQLGVPEQALDRVENMKRLLDQLRANNTSANARAYASDQVILRCEQLLAEPDVGVRVVACHLLNGLNTSWNPDIPYPGAADPLLKTFAFEDAQYITVKVVAADGLARILKDSPPNSLPILKRIAISENIATEINRLRDARGQPNAAPKVGYDWAMWGLVRALGFSDRVMNQARQPVIADTLQRVMFDRNEDWLTRARAADSLCHLPYEANTNLTVLNYEIARLTHDAAQQYNSELAAGAINPMWRRTALHLYMSYEAPNQAARNLNQGLIYQTNRSGLAGHKPQIQAARNLVLPIVNAWIGQPQARPIPAGDIQNLADWLNANGLPPGTKLMDESQVRPQPVQPPTPPQQPLN